MEINALSLFLGCLKQFSETTQFIELACLSKTVRSVPAFIALQTLFGSTTAMSDYKYR